MAFLGSLEGAFERIAVTSRSGRKSGFPFAAHALASRQSRQPRPDASGGNRHMATSVNAGARLDRLPISSFHYRIFWLIGAGMFFDGYDLYVAGGVLASTIASKFSTVPQNLQFISLTFVGMRSEEH